MNKDWLLTLEKAMAVCGKDDWEEDLMAVAQAQLQKDNERFAKREQEIRQDEREKIMSQKCKEFKCPWYMSENPYGSAAVCRHMTMKLQRMVMVKELKTCDEVKGEANE